MPKPYAFSNDFNLLEHLGAGEGVVVFLGGDVVVSSIHPASESLVVGRSVGGSVGEGVVVG